MGSVSRLEPTGVKSSLGHISKTKLLNNLDLKFSYSRQRNARACYKISIWIVNKISISSVSSHPPWVQCPGLASLVSLCQSGQYPPRACAPPLMGATVNWSLITGVGPNLSQIYWLYSPIPFYKWPINAVRAVMRGPATSPTLHFASVVTSTAITDPRPALATLCTREVE